MLAVSSVLYLSGGVASGTKARISAFQEHPKNYQRHSVVTFQGFCMAITADD
jgi:hypothetical protein